MGRLKELRKYTDKALRKAIDDPDELKKAYVHLYGVSLAAGMISEKRGQNTELACMAAMLHDMYAYTTGSYEDHAHKGADLARKILEKLGITSEEETDIICSAIYHHDDKASVDSPMDEVLKDADVVHHTMNDPEKPIKEKERKRYDALRAEFGLSAVGGISYEQKKKATIDVSFDIRKDAEGKDPDSGSPTLRRYHKLLWSKRLPNGEVMELRREKNGYLYWKGFSFGSDGITTSFRYKSKQAQKLLAEVKETVDDYSQYMGDFLRKAWTISQAIIWPAHSNNMNGMRGLNTYIKDRWDLTLECIRRYYNGEDSPLAKVIKEDKDFFDLFVDFKGYVDFFFLQDCVSEDYSKVKIWCGDASFEKSGLPETVGDYFKFIRKEHEFLDKRNGRIQKGTQGRGNRKK